MLAVPVLVLVQAMAQRKANSLSMIPPQLWGTDLPVHPKPTTNVPESHRYTTFRTHPRSRPDVVFGGIGVQYRFTVLDEGVIRYEWAEDGVFEDRASTFAINRSGYNDPSGIYFYEKSNHLEITTKRFKLVYDKKEFTPSGLTAQVKGYVTEYKSVWRYGEPHETLGGTCRTLDGVDGRAELEPGIISKNGFVALDDSNTMLFEADGWVGSRRPGNRVDGYLFAFGRDYYAAVKAFWNISGCPPRIPSWALGNWWSRYHPYTADEYIQLVDKFREEEIPLSVAVLDMDWHQVDIDPNLGSGWTGYTWNRNLFPDPQAFLAALHERHLHVVLNVHPADGVRQHEQSFLEMAAALGRNPALPIPFDVTDRKFLDAYFDILHRNLEKDGVDFWWIDWQQGRHCKIPNIDPLWMLNHFHYHDNALRADSIGSLPLTFSRYAGPGSQRYPIGFSGDTVVSWESLHFQPEFTATASNIGYTWWSHDIGGHWGGVRDDELATRWVQLGCFSPILRLHSSYNKWNRKEPWMFSPEACETQTFFLRYRHRLIPYIQFFDENVGIYGPLVKPMYWDYPNDEEAYQVPNQFRFGHLIIAPITTPRDPRTLLGSVKAWLPPGRFVDLINEMWYDGDREIILHRTLKQYPVLAPAGSITVLDGSLKPESGARIERYDVLLAKPRTPADYMYVVAVEGCRFSWRSPELGLDGNSHFVDLVLLIERNNEPAECKEIALVVLGGGMHDFQISFHEDLSQGIHSISNVGQYDYTVNGDSSVLITKQAMELTRGQNITVGFRLRFSNESVTDCKTNIFTAIDRILMPAQVEHNLKSKIWDAIQKPGAKETKIGRILAIDMHQPLKDALMEVLTADSQSESTVMQGMEELSRKLR